MKFNAITGNLTISSRKFVAVTLLTSGTLAWFFLFQVYFSDIFMNISPDIFWVNMGTILFYGFGIFSAILGSFVAKKMDRRNFLFAWITLGIISTIFLILFQGIIFSVICGILLGISLGLGLPSSMAFLADYTTVEERGRVAGITILETFIMAFLTLGIVRVLGGEIIIAVALITLVRAVSFLALLVDKRDDPAKTNECSVLHSDYKEFIYYIFPWIIFSVTAGLAWNLFSNNPDLSSAVSLGTVLRYAFIAIFGFVWGIVSDRFGRKQPIIIGLIILGVSFALLSFEMSSLSVLIYLTLSGVAWGAFLTIYLVIPGDLSSFGSREKFYALGTISPIIILFSLSLIDFGNLFTLFSASSFAQILSILLFVSLVPILRAKETLLESKIRKRKLKEYTDKVGKIVKESKKTE